VESALARSLLSWPRRFDDLSEHPVGRPLAFVRLNLVRHLEKPLGLQPIVALADSLATAGHQKPSNLGAPQPAAPVWLATDRTATLHLIAMRWTALGLA